MALHGSWLPVPGVVFIVGRMFTDLPTQVTAYACLLKSTVMMCSLRGDHFKEPQVNVKLVQTAAASLQSEQTELSSALLTFHEKQVQCE